MSKGRKGTGHIRQRSAGSYNLMWQGPVGPDGKRQRLTKTFKGTATQANKELQKLILEASENPLAAHTKHTVSTYINRWMETYVKVNIRKRTQQGYESKIRAYITPTIGNMPMQELQPYHIQDVYDGMSAKGLSARSVINLHKIIRQSFQYGVDLKLLAHNPTDGLKPPRHIDNQKTWWDKDQVMEFFKKAQSFRPRHLPLFQLAFLTGMRRSELAGLKWEHVDLVSTPPTIHVKDTLQRIIGEGLVTGKPKTKGSNRKIEIGKMTVALLRHIQGGQQVLKMELGSSRQSSSYVFTRPDGRPIDPDQATHDFTDIVRQTDLPPITLHDLRHCHATDQLKNNVPMKIVSERLGHANIGITMNLYSHVLTGMQKEAADSIEEGLEITLF